MKNYTSPNFDKRPKGTKIDTLILHYTGMKSGIGAVKKLCNPDAKVSSHYVVDEAGKIFELVPCEYRAWHAGRSIWRGRENVNDFSVGIEIVNPGHEYGYRKFPKKQMGAVVELCKTILKNHPIEQRNVIGHSDIAPARKMDPGELFDWKLLAENGVGLWPEDKNLESGIRNNGTKKLLKIGDSGKEVKQLQTRLAKYGYGIVPDGKYEEQMVFVVKAFQRHFGSTKKINGVWDTKLENLLNSLLKLV